MSEMDKLDFLLGCWRGKSEDQFGEKGVLESSSECIRILDGRFLRWDGETRKNGVPLNQSIQFISYDSAKKRYFFKRMWSYGFVENGEGTWENNDTLMFDIASVDNRPAWFEGILWRSFIRKYSDSEIGHGLLTSKRGGPYELYGETHVFRANG